VKPGRSGPVRIGFLQDARRLLDEDRVLAGLAGDALAWLLARGAADRRLLVVVDEADRRDALVRALRFFGPALPVEPFPSDDNRPYDGFSADPALGRQRIRALARIEAGGSVVVVADARALLQRVPDRAARDAGTVHIARGGTLDRDQLVGRLTDAGYLQVGAVEADGTFAVRGDVVDVWPAAGRFAARIDFFDDTVEDLRRLEPGRAKPAGKLERLLIMPAAEERVDAAALARFQEVTGRAVDAAGAGRGLRRRLLDDLEAGIRPSALGDWLPALVPVVDPLVPLADLARLVVFPDDVDAALRDVVSNARRRWEALDAEEERPILPPEERFADVDGVAAALRDAIRVVPIALPGIAVDLGAVAVDGFAVRGSELNPVVARLRALLDADARVVVVAESDARASRIAELLDPHHLPIRRIDAPADAAPGFLSLVVGDLPAGFVAEASGLAFIPAAALFGGGAAAQRRIDRAHALFERAIQSLAQLKVGDPVVHRIHGIGRYIGLQRVSFTRPEGPADGTGASFRHVTFEQDFVKLAYRDEGVLFVPVASLDVLSAYTPASQDHEVVLDRLGGQTWQLRRSKVRDRLLSMADAMLRQRARRELATRPGIGAAGPLYRAFADRFPYDETPDQAAAIEAILADLAAEHPMDRLVCGDVGFGKTEVAMRAAMASVEAGRQVAILCPTTVLAYQHLHTFQRRFEGFPVRVGMLSRFNSATGNEEVIADLAAHRLDIVVGTTALLGPRVRYAQLGLLVVDEEHRFGVKQKERIQRLRAEVDVLAMSATPIPRTLQLALSGLRTLSLITTPPRDRLAVRTSVARLSETRVRDAIIQELDRGGQTFFVHNAIDTLPAMMEQLRTWVPEARFVAAHGQMPEGALERVLVDFVERKYDVLVCTSIVESGVHMPTVNTMIVNRADMFGLAQLYQLRGRVGRAAVRGSCLLLVPEVTTSESRRRMRALTEHTEIGSGFQIAAADLEIRGGGNLLGSSQSGAIDEVGFDAWLELLQEAVHEVQGVLDLERIDPEIDIPVPAFIPEDLIKDPIERLGWYRRLSGAGSPAAVDAAVEELEQMLGGLPEPVQNLAGMMAVRAACVEWGIVHVRWLKVRVVLELHERSRLDAPRAAEIVARHPKRFEARLEDGKLRALAVRFTPGEAETPLRYLRWIFAQIARRAT
jgi:transcription-repair coupling factor (superfamily II helicase)